MNSGFKVLRSHIVKKHFVPNQNSKQFFFPPIQVLIHGHTLCTEGSIFNIIWMWEMMLIDRIFWADPFEDLIRLQYWTEVRGMTSESNHSCTWNSCTKIAYYCLFLINLATQLSRPLFFLILFSKISCTCM